MTSREWCWSRRLLVEARRKPLQPRALPGRAGAARRETRQRPEVGLWGPHPVQTARSCGAQLPPGRTEPRGGSIRAPSRNLQPQPPTRPRPPYLLKRNSRLCSPSLTLLFFSSCSLWALKLAKTDKAKLKNINIGEKTPCVFSPTDSNCSVTVTARE